MSSASKILDVTFDASWLALGGQWRDRLRIDMHPPEAVSRWGAAPQRMGAQAAAAAAWG